MGRFIFGYFLLLAVLGLSVITLTGGMSHIFSILSPVEFQSIGQVAPFFQAKDLEIMQFNSPTEKWRIFSQSGEMGMGSDVTYKLEDNKIVWENEEDPSQIIEIGAPQLFVEREQLQTKGPVDLRSGLGLRVESGGLLIPDLKKRVVRAVDRFDFYLYPRGGIRLVESNYVARVGSGEFEADFGARQFFFKKQVRALWRGSKNRSESFNLDVSRLQLDLQLYELRGSGDVALRFGDGMVSSQTILGKFEPLGRDLQELIFRTQASFKSGVGALDVSAEEIRIYPVKEELIFSGGVLLRKEGKTMQADQVRIYDGFREMKLINSRSL